MFFVEKIRIFAVFSHKSKAHTICFQMKTTTRGPEHPGLGTNENTIHIWALETANYAHSGSTQK
jgi:hypothetical protein